MSKSQAQSTQTKIVKILRNRSTDFIEDEKSRRKAFMKRITTLKKKAEELSTLCDVEVCMVCFGLDGKFHVFPEEPEKAKAIILKQKECSSKGISCKKKLNLAGLSRKDLKPKSVTLDEKTKLQKGKAKQVCKGENFGQNMVHEYKEPQQLPSNPDTNFSYLSMLMMDDDDQTNVTTPNLGANWPQANVNISTTNSTIWPQANVNISNTNSTIWPQEYYSNVRSNDNVFLGNQENKLGLGLEENFGPMGENYCLQLKNNTPQEVMGFGMAENFGMMQQNNHLLPMIPQQQSPFMKFCQENHLQSKMNHNS
jgi:hypothetical protein